jgi:hypothetical protein
MKHFAILIITISVTASLFGQSSFPYDSVSHTLIYHQSFKLNPKVKTEDIYASSLAWFGEAARFTNKNADPPTDTAAISKNKRRRAAEEQFANPRPLQMQEPVGHMAQGMGIIRYYGSMNNAIKLLYLKYDITVRINADSASISVSNMHYFHYLPSSYKQVPVYSFAGGRPCEEVGAIESLITCGNFREEFTSLAQYCNKVIYGQMGDYKNLLKQKKYLYEPKALAAAPAKAKAPSKGTVKKK